MEQSNGSQRCSWKNPELLKFFLEQCIHEINQYGRQGNSLKPESWPRVSKAIETKFGRHLTQKQMKNEYDYLKEKYRAWVKLIGKIENAHNYETNMINLTPLEWDDYIKDHPKAKPLRTQGLAFPELCSALYGGITSNRSRKRGRSCTNPRLGTSQTVAPPPLELPPPFQLQSIGINECTAENEDQSLHTPGAQSKATNSISHEERASKRSKLAHSSHLGELMNEVLDLIIKKHSGPSVVECIKKLEQLGWDKTKPSYLIAMGIFCEGQGYRDTWMIFKDDDTKTMDGWIMLVGHRLGYC